jgi:hypothetical protein
MDPEGELEPAFGVDAADNIGISHVDDEQHGPMMSIRRPDRQGLT